LSQTNKPNGLEFHPAIERAESLLMRQWEDVLLDSVDPFTNPDCAEKVLSMLPEETCNKIRAKWGSHSDDGLTSHGKWLHLQEALEKATKSKSNGVDARAYVLNCSGLSFGIPILSMSLTVNLCGSNFVFRTLRRIIFSCAYPRIDIDVTKQQNHLLKAPFCIHPKTEQVCVPIDPEQCEQFNPADVPTLRGLLTELDSHDDASSGQASTNDKRTEEALESTSLALYVKIFRQSFLEPLVSEAQASARQQARKQSSLDW